MTVKNLAVRDVPCRPDAIDEGPGLSDNHPSGMPEPSRADLALTKRLQDVLALVDVRVLDHIAVDGVKTVSLAERGLICWVESCPSSQ